MRVYYATDLRQIYVEGTAQLWPPLSLTVNTYPDGPYICTALTERCILGPLTPGLVQRQDGTPFTDLPSAVAYLQGEFAKLPPGSTALSYPINGVASITANHGLTYAPSVTILDALGIEVEADVIHVPGATTLMFSSPFTGLLYLR